MLILLLGEMNDAAAEVLRRLLYATRATTISDNGRLHAARDWHRVVRQMTSRPDAISADARPTPDLERFGGIRWVRRTKGVLTAKEKRRLMGVVVAKQGAYIAGRIKLATGRVPTGAAVLDDPELLAPPDSAWARAAEGACREQQTETIGHSYRTWAFGRALAALDGADVDVELLYTAALVHDFGLEHPVPGEDFTIRSADRVVACAREAGVDDFRSELAADAIAIHAHPSVDPELDLTGAWIQAGALCDLGGFRLWDLPKPWVQKVIEEYPRDGVIKAVVAMIGAESKAVPDGRFALLRRCGYSQMLATGPKYGTAGVK